VADAGVTATATGVGRAACVAARFPVVSAGAGSTLAAGFPDISAQDANAIIPSTQHHRPAIAGCIEVSLRLAPAIQTT
jgi:hypothetical protein